MLLTLTALHISTDWHSGDQIGILFPLDLDTKEMVERIARAGGVPVRQTGLANAWVATSSTADFPERLSDTGVIGLFSPLVTGGCASDSSAIAFGE